MPEQATNPATQEVESPQPSVEQRLAAVFSKEKNAQPDAKPAAKAETAAPAEEVAKAEEQPESDEPTAEDLPEDTAPAQAATGDEFEIVHNGQSKKLSRAETIELAQKGFDYTEKTQVLAQQRKASEEVMQRLSNLEQLIPNVMEDFAQVKAMDSRMKEWEKVDWITLAQSNPTEYPVHRARFDQERLAYEQARAGLAQKVDVVKAEKAKVNADLIKQEIPRLLERIPEWRNTEKYQAEARQLSDYLLSQGAAPERVENLTDSLSVALAYKAMKYDALIKQKSEKVKLLQQKPPVPKAGASEPKETASQQQAQQMRQRLRKSGDWRDAAALLSRMK